MPEKKLFKIFVKQYWLIYSLLLLVSSLSLSVTYSNLIYVGFFTLLPATFFSLYALF